MQKTILITGATDGIGLKTAQKFAENGHNLLLHGRSKEKLDRVMAHMKNVPNHGSIDGYIADLSDLGQVENLAKTVAKQHETLDVLINNAGVFKIAANEHETGIDLRFVVNTIAPYLLTKSLMALFSGESRVVNLSSAAQTTVDLEAFSGKYKLSNNAAYAQSKLALTMWTNHMAAISSADQPAFIAVNPASMLGSKMVKNAYGVDGHDLAIGADILFRAGVSDEFNNASGRYFDNDIRQFSLPHKDASDPGKCARLVEIMDHILY